MKPVWIGCSGWSYEDWRGKLYPKGLPPARWLETYAETFDTVEVNNTFYRLPTLSAVEGWVERSPPGFLFTVKASRYLTHIKRLTDMAKGIELFCERIEPLRASGKLGPLLWQLPPRFARDDERLATALEQLPPGRHAFEFREPSWFAPEVYEVLREHGVALVIADHQARDYYARTLTAGWTFVRFHHGRAGRGNYGRRELDTWKRRIASWRARVEVFAYFNNDWRGFAPRNALYLKNGLSRAG